jgi:hypothetical protein
VPKAQVDSDEQQHTRHCSDDVVEFVQRYYALEMLRWRRDLLKQWLKAIRRRSSAAASLLASGRGVNGWRPTSVSKAPAQGH